MADAAVEVEAGQSKRERECVWCGAVFSHGNARRTLCSSRCKKAAYNERHRSRINRKQAIRNRTPEALKQRLKYQQSPKGRRALQLHRREWTRKRAAAAALSALLMPARELRMPDQQREWPEQKQPPLEWPEKGQ